MYKLGIFAVTAILAGCVSHDPVRLHTYWGTTIERPPVGTIYDWTADSAHIEEGQDPAIRSAVQEDIEAEMAAVGFIKRSTETPGILVSVHWGRGLQPSPSGGEQRATISFKVFGAESGRLIYCASADALVEPSMCPEDRRARIDLAIREIVTPLRYCNPCPKNHSHGRCASCDR